jgi:hypothetical protein
MSDLFIDKGKPAQRQGRKAKGPKAKAMAAWPPKGEIFHEKNYRFGFGDPSDCRIQPQQLCWQCYV